jgi:predicted TIM-barrel fold metal-dependent hydrolase
MFETDFPHPTCLFPDPLTKMAGVLEKVDYESRQKLLSGNAAFVYNVDVPA